MQTIVASTGKPLARLGFSSLLLVAAMSCAPSSSRPLGAATSGLDDAGDDAPSTVEPAASADEPPRRGSSEDDAAASDGDAGDPSGSDGAAPESDDGSPDDDAPSGDDGPPEGACTQPLAPGDLVIDELMIESVAGTGDYGEWLEVASALDCTVDLRGLHGECPRGAKVVTFDVSDDLWIPPHGFFVVADSVDPTVNHDLPGVVIGWLGSPGDVLRNDGTTITLSVAGTVIDTLTYPELSLTVGASMEFPSDCAPSQRTDFSTWQTATASWFPGFEGTPSAANTDVSCQ
jgi:hypothetical protein